VPRRDATPVTDAARAPAVVLDASALLALLHAEPGGDTVVDLISSSCISAVNWCEVFGKLRAAGIDAAALVEGVEQTGIRIVPFDAEQARVAGELHVATRQAGLSLADRACLALASELEAPAVTADRAWARLDVGVEVRCIRA
jgi:PIN domain nuclease of toxin-antitoxin system